jgi:hypothetical protein
MEEEPLNMEARYGEVAQEHGKWTGEGKRE